MKYLANNKDSAEWSPPSSVPSETSILLSMVDPFSEVTSLADGLFKMKLCHLHEVVASVFEWVFTDKNIQIELIERYFEYLLNKNKNKI